MELGERFWSKVDVLGDDQCWVWIAAKRHGYGRYWLEGRRQSAHKLTYEAENGPIPEGNVVDHICRNRACVNPRHMQLTTNGLNLQNRSGANANSGSGVRGVSRTPYGTFSARGRVNNRQYHLGSFPSMEEAEAAVIAWRRENQPNSLMDREVAA